MHPALRRAAQFTRAITARVRENERALVRESLSPEQAALFFSMQRSDQRHCLDVYGTLVRAGYGDDDLLCAALLHDVGKAQKGIFAPDVFVGEPAGFRRPTVCSRQMTVFHRVAIVLLQALDARAKGSRWLDRLAADGRGWRAPFAIHARHAQAGAERAQAAGCSPTVVALIREHHDDAPGGAPPEHWAALQWADGEN